MTSSSLSITVSRLFAVVLIALAGACARQDLKSFRGVTEGEIVKLAAPVAGNLSSLDVARGATVSEGARLFSQAEAAEILAHADVANRLERIKSAKEKSAGATRDEIETLKNELAQAEWKLMLKSASAPATGIVIETLYRQGDWVPAGAPVVAILPVEKLKVSFEVPLVVAAQLQNGRAVTLICRQCEGPVQANISYISPFATSQSSAGSSQELRYRVEARPVPQQAALLKPGQSVTVNL